MVDERKAKYADKTLKIQEIQQFENDIVSIKSQIKKIEPIVKKKIQPCFTQKLKLRDCMTV